LCHSLLQLWCLFTAFHIYCRRLQRLRQIFFSPLFSDLH
jgi:hypothetical protein